MPLVLTITLPQMATMLTLAPSPNRFERLGTLCLRFPLATRLYPRRHVRDVLPELNNQVMMTLTNRTASAKTTIRNYNDEEVILSGARAITGT